MAGPDGRRELCRSRHRRPRRTPVDPTQACRLILSWQQRLAEVNARNGKVVLAHLFPSSGAAGNFEQSKLKLILEDQMGPGRLASDDGLFGYIPQLAGAGRLGGGAGQGGGEGT